MASSTTRSRLPSSRRLRIENEMIRKRDRQHKHDELWQKTTKYFDDVDKKNRKYDEWTSPRYYQSNTKLMNEFIDKRKKQDNIVQRRNQLRQLLQDDERYEQIELMIKKTKQQMIINDNNDDDEQLKILKNINENLKIEENDRRRHEAEFKLYHQWRNNNPVLQEYERYKQLNDIKLSWLDQQIEKRLNKEKEEEECRTILQQHQQQLIEEQQQIEETKKTYEQKQQQLKLDLEQQILELNKKQQISEELKIKENEELKKRLEFEIIEEQAREFEKKRQNRECALFNLKQYKLKLKQKAQIIEDSLEDQKQLIEQLKKLEIIEKIEDRKKREELQTTIEQFLGYNREQKQLEKLRQYHLDFLFDSEAKCQFEQHNDIWQKEEMARQQLLNDILKTIQLQIDENLRKNQQKQKEIIEDRELLLQTIEQYNNEMEELKKHELDLMKNQTIDNKKQTKLKSLKKKIEKNHELERINKELESVRKEEERLKREILNIQKRQGPIRPARSRILL